MNADSIVRIGRVYELDVNQCVGVSTAVVNQSCLLVGLQSEIVNHFLWKNIADGDLEPTLIAGVVNRIKVSATVDEIAANTAEDSVFSNSSPDDV